MELHVKREHSSSDGQHPNRARMLISCPDGPGIVAAVSRFLFEHGANIVQSDQYTMDPSGGMFFMRIEFDLPELEKRMEQLQAEFGEIAGQFQMNWQMFNVSHKRDSRSSYRRRIIVLSNCSGSGRRVIWMPISRWL